MGNSTVSWSLLPCSSITWFFCSDEVWFSCWLRTTLSFTFLTISPAKLLNTELEFEPEIQKSKLTLYQRILVSKAQSKMPFRNIERKGENDGNVFPYFIDKNHFWNHISIVVRQVLNFVPCQKLYLLLKDSILAFSILNKSPDDKIKCWLKWNNLSLRIEHMVGNRESMPLLFFPTMIKGLLF